MNTLKSETEKQTDFHHW